MPLLIDGYNLLWAIQKQPLDGAEISDLGLCRIIDEYLDVTGQEGEIVFDGTGPPEKTEFYQSVSILVITFAGADTDADTIIINSVKNSTAPRQLTVVSNDGKIRRSVKTRNATVVSSEEFWRQLRRMPRKRRRSAEPSAKIWGINDSETSQWLRTFGLGGSKDQSE